MRNLLLNSASCVVGWGRRGEGGTGGENMGSCSEVGGMLGNRNIGEGRGGNWNIGGGKEGVCGERGSRMGRWCGERGK